MTIQEILGISSVLMIWESTDADRYSLFGTTYKIYVVLFEDGSGNYCKTGFEEEWEMNHGALDSYNLASYIDDKKHPVYRRAGKSPGYLSDKAYRFIKEHVD